MDLDTLLLPVSDAAPCGEDLLFSPEFDAIQEARRSDDPSLDQGEWVTDLKSADWPAVIGRCEAMLRERTKDLRLAVWYAEALARTRGYAGLAQGFRTVASLCARFWDEIHPLADEGDQEQRVGNLAWLLVNAVQWAREIPLIEGPRGTRYGLAQFEAARARAVAEREGEAVAEDEPSRPSLARLEELRRETSFGFYQRAAAEAPDCLAALAELQGVVDARLGMDGPSFSATRDAIDLVVSTQLRFAREAGVSGDGGAVASGKEGGADAVLGDADEVGEAAAVPRASGEIRSRKEALVQLRRVADYFRRTEPHSPVAYLADKAARWGEMPLHVWLRTVVKDEAALSHLEEMLDVGTLRAGEEG